MQDTFALASAAVAVSLNATRIQQALQNAEWVEGDVASEIEEMEVYVQLLEEAVDSLFDRAEPIRPSILTSLRLCQERLEVMEKLRGSGSGSLQASNIVGHAAYFNKRVQILTTAMAIAAPLQQTQDHLDKPAPADGKPRYEIPDHAEPELVDCMVPKTFHFTAAIELEQNTFRVPWAQFDTASTYNWISKELVKTLGLSDEIKKLELSEELRNTKYVSFNKSEVEPLGTIKLSWYAANFPPPQVPLTTEFLVGKDIAVRLAIGSEFILDKELLVYNFKSLGEGINVLLCNKKSKVQMPEPKQKDSDREKREQMMAAALEKIRQDTLEGLPPQAKSTPTPPSSQTPGSKSGPDSQQRGDTSA
ncbi:hypothetical protein ASPCAL03443 [Aspergillus calidoustus]|uniref:Uncharacterized protein n=1 Tax=Aspergillus calidoustus TaxID=454130 RepID=A0A0U5FS00_ASPCI|nr:hypothetical protein ASPCAL03443 [Aspergillus calidoustus]